MPAVKIKPTCIAFCLLFAACSTLEIKSPDGRRSGKLVPRMSEVLVVVDGQKVGRGYGTAGNFSFSPDSRRYAFVGKAKDSYRVVIDGNEGKAYGGISKGYPVFSPDSRRVLYVATQDGRRVFVVDTEEVLRDVDKIDPVLFRRLADLYKSYPPEIAEAIYILTKCKLECQNVVEILRYQLTKEGTAAVGPLVDALKEEDIQARKAVAQALGRLCDARATQPLKALIFDADASVASVAEEALGNCEGSR